MSSSPPTYFYLIWQVDPNAIWEADWIRFLLSQLPILEVFDYGANGFPHQSIVVDRGIIVDNHLEEATKRAYYDQFKAHHYSAGLIHLSDEGLNDHSSLYNAFQFVLRNYWHPLLHHHPHLLTIPLGYKSGFQISHPLPSSRDRPYTWCFMGQLTKSTRIRMFNHVISIPNGFIYLIERFNDPNALSVQDYQRILEHSIFALCPMGFISPDTFRLYEALEAGCIPVVENLALTLNNTHYPYFASFLGNHPFLLIDDWSQIQSLLPALLAQPDQLEEKRLQCHHWWLRYKQHLLTTIPHFIQTHTLTPHSRSFPSS